MNHDMGLKLYEQGISACGLITALLFGCELSSVDIDSNDAFDDSFSSNGFLGISGGYGSCFTSGFSSISSSSSSRYDSSYGLFSCFSSCLSIIGIDVRVFGMLFLW